MDHLAHLSSSSQCRQEYALFKFYPPFGKERGSSPTKLSIIHDFLIKVSRYIEQDLLIILL